MTRWCEIPGWEGLYAVSDDGQVKSLPRPRRKTERVLVLQQETTHPYWFVTFWRGRKAYHRRVHNLMLEAFVGPRPAGSCGLHADDDPNNNDLSNLRWGTLSDNALDMVRNGSHNHARKTHCKWGHPFTGARNAKQRICRECHKRRNAEYLARKGPRSRPTKVCPACDAPHTRRSKFCSEACRARTLYRLKVGTPIDAPKYQRRVAA
jgi:hypothetical protein